MNKPLFIFFGCSWTWGRYINWNQYHSTDPRQMPHDAEVEQSKLYSYRSLITKHFDADQVNFSEGGASNDQQLRRASEYFLGVRNLTDGQVKLFDRNLYDKVVVLWFITATTRKEVYNDHSKSYEKWLFNLRDDPKPTPGMGTGLLPSVAKDWMKHGYYCDHEALKHLSAQKILWNAWFKNNAITNVWIDTFNHNDWNIALDNQIKFDSMYSDIMTNMYLTACNLPLPTDIKPHKSVWEADEQRSMALRDAGLLNPASLHPTVQGHRLVADLLIPKLTTTLGL